MTIGFRLFLALGALFAFYVVIRNIRKSKLLISDCIFWTLFCVFIVLLAIFPGMSYFFAGLLGIQSPVNLVYLFVLALALYISFKQTLRISELECKIKNIVQDITLERKK